MPSRTVMFGTGPDRVAVSKTFFPMDKRGQQRPLQELFLPQTQCLCSFTLGTCITMFVFREAHDLVTIAAVSEAPRASHSRRADRLRMSTKRQML